MKFTSTKAHLAARLGLALFMLAPALSQAAGDIKLGGDKFAENCAECHSLKEGKNKKGPSLFAAFGRPAASVAGFKYSEAMKAAKFSWTPEQLDAYLALPKQAVPGGSMKYDGMGDAHARADLIAFLTTIK